MSFNQFSPELLMKVLSHLYDVPSKIRLERVNTRFRDCIRKMESWKYNTELTTVELESVEKLRSFLSHTKVVHTLELCLSGVTAKYLATLLKFSDKLKITEFSYLANPAENCPKCIHAVAACLGKCANTLEFADFNCCGNDKCSTVETISYMLPSCHNLRELGLGYIRDDEDSPDVVEGNNIFLLDSLLNMSLHVIVLSNFFSTVNGERLAAICNTAREHSVSTIGLTRIGAAKPDSMRFQLAAFCQALEPGAARAIEHLKLYYIDCNWIELLPPLPVLFPNLTSLEIKHCPTNPTVGDAMNIAQALGDFLHASAQHQKPVLLQITITCEQENQAFGQLLWNSVNLIDAWHSGTKRTDDMTCNTGNGLSTTEMSPFGSNSSEGFRNMGHPNVEYGTFLGDSENNFAQFRLHNAAQPIVAYDAPLSGKCKPGNKFVLIVSFKTPECQHQKVLEIIEIDSIVEGTGTVNYVQRDFGYISSDLSRTNNIVFFFAQNFYHPTLQYPNTTLSNAVKPGSRVRFEAIPQDNHTKAQYRAVRVYLIESVQMISKQPAGMNELSRNHNGIIVKAIPDKSVHMWCKELGRVFLRRSRLREPLDQYTAGILLSFDAYEQPEFEHCSWSAINPTILQDSIQFTMTLSNSGFKNTFKIINSAAVVANIQDGKATLWSPLLGKIAVSVSTDGFGKGTLGLWDSVLFDAEQNLLPEFEDVGWKATKIQSSVPKFDLSFEYCIAQLSRIPKPCMAILFNTEWGEITCSWLDFCTSTANAVQFADELRKHKYFEVRFVRAFKHCKVPWNAVHVKPYYQVPQDDFTVENNSDETSTDEVDSFWDELDTFLQEPNPDEIVFNHQDPIPHLAAASIQKTDNEIQTTPTSEFRVLGLIRDNQVLLDIVKIRHRNKILLLTQILSRRFTPNYQTAKAEHDNDYDFEAYGCRHMLTQTAFTPEVHLARELITDEEIFNLLMDIDADLLLSMT